MEMLYVSGNPDLSRERQNLYIDCATRANIKTVFSFFLA
jgi:hypothetical protein